MVTKPLSKIPARNDLTDRECAKILSGVAGCLTQMAEVETVRDALRWLANNDDFWKAIEINRPILLAMAAKAQEETQQSR